MRTISALCVSFFIGINILLTAVWLWPVETSIQKQEELIRSEGIITKTAGTRYPKQLDSFYFNLASLLIPTASFLFWWLVAKRQSSWASLSWVFAFAWFVVIVSVLVGQLSPRPPG